MRNIFITISILTFSFLIGCQHKPVAPSPVIQVINSKKGVTDNQVNIINSEFGIFKKDKKGEPIFSPTRKVPLKVNQEYGWIVELKDSNTPVKWREEFILPSASKTWGKNPKKEQIVSEDRKVSVTEKIVSPFKSIISNSWFVAPGDPKGHYVIKLVIENTDPIIFEFDVQ